MIQGLRIGYRASGYDTEPQDRIQGLRDMIQGLRTGYGASGQDEVPQDRIQGLRTGYGATGYRAS